MFRKDGPPDDSRNRDNQDNSSRDRSGWGGGGFRDRNENRGGGFGDRGGFRDNRSGSEGGDRGGFRENRGGGGFGGGDRGGFRDNRGSGGGFGGGDRGGFRDNRGGGGDREGGFRENRGGGGNWNDREPREQDESVFSKRLRAGKRRTYFFDVRATKGNDYFVTLTESTRKMNGFGYDRHKMFLYKEDFNRFVESLQEVVNHVKTELMPDYDYDEFARRQLEWEAQNREADNEDDGGVNAESTENPNSETTTDELPTAEDKPKKEDDDVEW